MNQKYIKLLSLFNCTTNLLLYAAVFRVICADRRKIGGSINGPCANEARVEWKLAVG